MREGVALKAIGPVIFPRRNPGAGIGTLALQRIALRFRSEAVAVASSGLFPQPLLMIQALSGYRKEGEEQITVSYRYHKLHDIVTLG